MNQDAFGEGWLAVIEPIDWPADRQQLLDAKAYFTRMKKEAEEEFNKP